MAVQIMTIEYHKGQLARIREQQQRRIDQQLDVEDCALSSWGDDSMRGAHNLAIEALERGLKECGEEVPYGDFAVLVDTSDGRIVDAKLITTRCKYSHTDRRVWLLADDEQERYQRVFIPTDHGRGTSRIQKKLGLAESRKPYRAKRWLGAACAGLGLPVSHYLERED